jgi:2-dehydro-3-deoxygalactonokinase
MHAAALIALDWGTTNLRAWRLDAAGVPLERRESAQGITQVADGRFCEALVALCGDWLDDADPVPLLAAGMIGSRQGWREARYLSCPAGLPEAAARLVPIAFEPGDGRRGRVLHIVPGVLHESPDGVADVMRGEETQVWGLGSAPARVLLPGTHSKWVEVDASSRIVRLRTYLTGELYAVLTQHSLLGRLMRFGESRPADFAQGVRLGLDHGGDATHILFAVRTAGLTGRVAPEGLPDLLSGMLIGLEMAGARAGLAAGGLSERVLLVGDVALTQRYEIALDLAGLAWTRADASATPRGLWRVAVAAGLVHNRA